MRPALTQNNFVYRFESNSKLFRNPSLNNSSLMQGSYFQNIFFGEFRQPGPFPSRRIAPLFLRLVGHVVLICSKKQMLWIDARWVVAFVANTKTGWDGSKIQKPNNAVGSPLLLAMNAQAGNSIAIFIPPSNPRPASDWRAFGFGG